MAVVASTHEDPSMPYRTPVEVGHRAAVGGRWEEMGLLQLNFLTERGLRPDHDFLDIGCGSLRAGVHLIPYLEPGRYVGVDQEQTLLDAGRDQELGAERYAQYRPTLVAMSDFSLPSIGRRFDVAMAQSVFTHLEFNLVARCLAQVSRVLNPGGVFFCTFFRNAMGIRHVDPILRDGFLSYCDQDPFHYDVRLMEWLGGQLGLRMKDIGEWGHPVDQQMLAFHAPGRSVLEPAE
jgi:SAM-dependent methyltransferase